jgi:hypothetical protein
MAHAAPGACHRQLCMHARAVTVSRI